MLALALRVTGRLQGRPSAWPFALVPPLAFLAQELIERLAAGLPAHAVLEPAVYVGLAAQLPIALLGFLAARALLRVADEAARGARHPPGVRARARRRLRAPIGAHAPVAGSARVRPTRPRASSLSVRRARHPTDRGGSRCGTRFAFLLVAGALALAGCGGGSKSTAPTTSTVAQATTTTPSTTTTTTTRTTTTAAPVTIRVLVKGGKPVGGIQRATVKKGQKVAIVVHSDVADEVHVHGYDLHKDVDAGGTVRIAFPATITGVFEAELESRKLQIVEFTVK